VEGQGPRRRVEQLVEVEAQAAVDAPAVTKGEAARVEREPGGLAVGEPQGELGEPRADVGVGVALAVLVDARCAVAEEAHGPGGYRRRARQ
jgi:hypothetical protein